MKNFYWVWFFCGFCIFLPAALRADDAKIQALKNAIQANPNDSTAHFNLGVSYLKSSQYDLAAPEFEKCVHLNSNDLQARELMESCLGISAFLKHDCASAVDHFQKTLKINPKNKDILVPLYQCQSKIAMEQKKYPEAVSALQNILLEDPNNFEALENLGVIFFQQKSQKSYQEAVGYWEKAVQIQKDSQTYKFLGFSYYNLGNFKQAIENYNLSIQLEKSKPESEQNKSSLDETYYDLGVAYVDNSLYDEAEDAFDHAFALNPKDSNAAVGKAQAIDSAINAHMDKANNFLLNNQYTDAISEWEKVLAYQPDNQQAKAFVDDAKNKLNTEVEKHYQSGLGFAKNKETVKALNEWNAALEMDPQNEKVKSAIKQTKTATSEQISALLQEGKQLETEKDYAGAMTKYQQAKSINPSSSSVQVKISKLRTLQTADLNKSMTLAKEKSMKGDYKSALQAYESAYHVDPANAEVKEALFETKRKIREKVDSLLEDGATLMESADKTSAKVKFEKVLSLDPNNEKANNSIQQLTGQQATEKVDADKVKALYYEGVNNYINGNIHEAVQKWQECLKLDPSNVNAKNNISKAMAKLQSIEQLNHN